MAWRLLDGKDTKARDWAELVIFYYNENEPYVAAWLRSLGEAGLIPVGQIDERSITEIRPEELDGYVQCHFFAGIAGWPYALQLAGWSPAWSVWTGSCPCQPFSAAGKRQGDSDDRNLWPEFFRLIRECRPPTIFGEQVEAAIGFGWLDRIFADLEGEGYVCGAAVLPAASVGAPHIRSRLFWVADASSQRRQQIAQGTPRYETSDGRQPNGDYLASGCSTTSGVAESEKQQYDRGRDAGSRWPESSDCSRLGDTYDEGSQGRRERPDERANQLSPWEASQANGLEHTASEQVGRAGFAWQDCRFIECGDGKTRRIGSGIQPLAHGVPARVGKLRAAGNAIVPQVAAEFIKAFLDERATD